MSSTPKSVKNVQGKLFNVYFDDLDQFIYLGKLPSIGISLIFSDCFSYWKIGFGVSWDDRIFSLTDQIILASLVF